MKAVMARADRLQIAANGEMPRIIHSGKLDGVTAVAEQAAHLIPFRARIINAYLRVRTAAGTAAYEVRIGKQGDDDFFAKVSVPTTAAAGTIIPVAPILVDIIAKDDVLMFAADGGATTTGDCDVVVVIEPAGPA